MGACYEICKGIASPQITNAVIYGAGQNPHCSHMLEKRALLTLVEARARSRAEIARVLGVAPPRVTEMFKDERALSYDEARKLCIHYKIEPAEMLNATRLVPILAACLRSEPQGNWLDSDVQRLAEEIEYGLELTRTAGPNLPSQDALDLAARVAADRFRHRRDLA